MDARSNYLGRRPGYGEATVHEKLTEFGVRRVGIPGKGRPSMARCGFRSRLSSPRPERTRGAWKEDPILGARVADVAPSLATRCGPICRITRVRVRYRWKSRAGRDHCGPAARHPIRVSPTTPKPATTSTAVPRRTRTAFPRRVPRIGLQKATTTLVVRWPSRAGRPGQHRHGGGASCSQDRVGRRRLAGS